MSARLKVTVPSDIADRVASLAASEGTTSAAIVRHLCESAIADAERRAKAGERLVPTARAPRASYLDELRARAWMRGQGGAF